MLQESGLDMQRVRKRHHEQIPLKIQIENVE
jgi:hypothetical protein